MFGGGREELRELEEDEACVEVYGAADGEKGDAAVVCADSFDIGTGKVGRLETLCVGDAPEVEVPDYAVVC